MWIYFKCSETVWKANLKLLGALKNTNCFKVAFKKLKIKLQNRYKWILKPNDLPFKVVT